MAVYRQKSRLLDFDALKCLRGDYYHNDCTECVDICPEEAFVIERGKLSLEEKECTSCGICVGVCPTEAVTVEFFDPTAYVESRLSEETLYLSCKEGIPCLSVFAVEHFISMGLEKKSVVCDLSGCAECEMNTGSKVLDSIKERIEKSKGFLEAVGTEYEIQIRDSFDPKASRREFFKKLVHKFSVSNRTRNDSSYVNRPEAPSKTRLLRDSLKRSREKIKNSVIKSEDARFISFKSIDKDLCTNCADCIKFCPTQALFHSGDTLSIMFRAGDCIACGICNRICQPKALSEREEIDLIEFAYERNKELVRHELKICKECKTPFVYRGDEICDRCKDFVSKFSDIFKLASDLK